MVYISSSIVVSFGTSGRETRSLFLVVAPPLGLKIGDSSALSSVFAISYGESLSCSLSNGC
jgi:hypothetical protein